jgi:hypothetical protein
MPQVQIHHAQDEFDLFEKKSSSMGEATGKVQKAAGPVPAGATQRDFGHVRMGRLGGRLSKADPSQGHTRIDRGTLLEFGEPARRAVPACLAATAAAGGSAHRG